MESQLRKDIEVIRLIKKGPINIHLQYNGSDNISVTNEITILHHVQDIIDHLISGVGKGITCTKKEYFIYNVKMAMLFQSKCITRLKRLKQ